MHRVSALSNKLGIVFSSNMHKYLLEEINDALKKVLCDFYYKLHTLSKSHLSAVEIWILIIKWKNSRKCYRKIVWKMISLDAKEVRWRSNYLTNISYYKILIYRNFVSLIRVKNFDSLMNKTIVSAAALHSKDLVQ